MATMVANPLLISKHTTYLCPDVSLFTVCSVRLFLSIYFHRNETERIPGARQGHGETPLQKGSKGKSLVDFEKKNVVSFSLQLWKTLVRFS